MVLNRSDSEARSYKEEDEAAGYESIDDIKPGKGKEDVNMKDVKVNGMTDEEFLNRYSRVNYLRLSNSTTFCHVKVFQIQKPLQRITT